MFLGAICWVLPPVTASPFVGRVTELRELREDLAAVSRGIGGCAVVEGPPGIGKSRLLATVAMEARELGVAVSGARATELDRVAPLSTFLAMLRDGDPPVLNSSDLPGFAGQSEASRFLLIDHLGELLEEYAAERPMLIAMDDLQWADEFTALMLRILVPRLGSSAALWLLARRHQPGHDSAGEALDRLIEEGARRIRLDPLSAVAVREMCENVVRAVPDDTVLGLAQRAAGNPFLLEELLTLLMQDGQIRVADGTASALPGDLPPDFVTAVNRRLSDLSIDARRLLEAGALLARPFTVHEVAGLVGRAPADLVDATEEVVDIGILVGSDVELSFRHELIREAIYGRLPMPIRQALHREAATVLRTEGRPAVEIATHLLQCARRGDTQAVDLLREAANDVASTAPGTAADLVVRTLDLIDEREPIRHTLVADAVRLLASAGRVADAIELGENALKDPWNAEAGSVILLGLAEALKHAGQHEAVVDCTSRALSRPDVDEVKKADVLAIRAHALLHTGEFDAANEAGSDAMDIGRRAGADAATVSGAEARSVVLRARGQLAEAVDMARGALETAERSGGEAQHRHPGLWLGRALVATDQFVEAESIYDIGRRHAEKLGSGWSLPLWHFYLADLQRDAGRLDDAVAVAEAGLRIAEQMRARATSPSLLAVLADVAVRRDDLKAAQENIEHGHRLVVGDLGLAAQDLAWGLAVILEARGEGQSSLETLTEAFHGLPQRVLLLAQNPAAGPHMVRIALATRDRLMARMVNDTIAELACGNPHVASLAGAAAHAEGLLRHDVAALRRAVEAYRFSPRPLAAASGIEDCARAEQALGHRSRAVELLDEALRGYVDCGSNRDAARARRRLRQLGVRRRPSRDSDTSSGWSTLTESELRVARLVAEGMTNRAVAERLFLSPHTIDSHIRHSFTKLGVSSRVELTRHVLAHEAAGNH